MIIQIPYGTIATGIAFLFGIWAIIMAETIAGRLALIGTMLALFLLPVVWASRVGRLVQLIGWVAFGLFCILFVKWKGVGIRG